MERWWTCATCGAAIAAPKLFKDRWQGDIAYCSKDCVPPKTTVSYKVWG